MAGFHFPVLWAIIPARQPFAKVEYEHSVNECGRGHHRAAAGAAGERLTRNNHITAMRDSFALAMPFVIVGSLLVPILFPPVSIDGASRFGRHLLLRPILLPTFQLTIGRWR